MAGIRQCLDTLQPAILISAGAVSQQGSTLQSKETGQTASLQFLHWRGKRCRDLRGQVKRERLTPADASETAVS